MFARKQCILCSALRHGCLTLLYVTSIRDFFCPWNNRAQFYRGNIWDFLNQLKKLSLVWLYTFCTMCFDWQNSQRQHIMDSNEFNICKQHIWPTHTALPTLLGPCTHIIHGLLGVYKVLWVVLYHFHDVLLVPTLLGVVSSVCTPLPTRRQQLPTLLTQQCWGLLRQLAHSLSPVA